MGQWTSVTEGWTLEPDVRGHILAAALAAPHPRFTGWAGACWSPSWVQGISKDARDSVLDKAATVSVLMGQMSTPAGKTDDDNKPYTPGRHLGAERYPHCLVLECA